MNRLALKSPLPVYPYPLYDLAAARFEPAGLEGEAGR